MVSCFPCSLPQNTTRFKTLSSFALSIQPYVGRDDPSLVIHKAHLDDQGSMMILPKMRYGRDDACSKQQHMPKLGELRFMESMSGAARSGDHPVDDGDPWYTPAYRSVAFTFRCRLFFFVTLRSGVLV